MRVGFDARALGAERPSGVERYVVNLVRALSQLPDGPEVIAYTDRPVAEPGIREGGPVRVCVVRARRGWLRAALPWRLWRDRVDLVHLPSTILPPLLPCPAVVTVHDLAWHYHPDTYAPADLRMQRRAGRSAQRAAHVIAVSESTARDVRQVLEVPRQRISVTPLGVSPSFSPDGPRLAADAFPGAERLSGGYLLYAGRLEARKNLLRLVEAYAQVRQAAGAPPLVLAGALGDYADEVARAAQRAGVGEEVIFAGYLAEETLAAAYRGAKAVVYLSLYEGVGLPLLEAMASGAPVVTANRSAMAETAGEAALLVDPESVKAIAEALGRVLSDAGLRARLARAGLGRSRLFTWERTAQETAAAWRRALHGP